MRALSQSFEADTPAKTFNPLTCFLFPTLDRGNKFFGGKPGYESASITQFLPSLPCISGFFSNGVLGRLDDFDTGSFDVSVHGSASAYVLIGSSK
jgi:small ligand-binding sensory domain FIST